MTPKQIAKRVQEGADARFDEVIERLLSLLERQHRPQLTTQQLVHKWHQTGLLDGLPDFVQETLAEWLEDATHKLIDWNYLEDPDSKVFEEKCGETLLGLRNKAKSEYERVEKIVKHSVQEGAIDPYHEIYHRHGFS